MREIDPCAFVARRVERALDDLDAAYGVRERARHAALAAQGADEVARGVTGTRIRGQLLDASAAVREPAHGPADGLGERTAQLDEAVVAEDAHLVPHVQAFLDACHLALEAVELQLDEAAVVGAA